jgi:uncharacterized protein
MSEAVLRAVLAGYTLPWDGVHGLRHWGRVAENGRRLAERTGADVRVVELFALFHDCRRTNEGWDPGHGLRGAEFARTLYDASALDLNAEQFEQLHYACTHHTDGLIEADPTVQTCWDADRLDLGRVWVTPEPRYLCTPPAKERGTIEWAEDRSRRNHEPPFVETWRAWVSGVE